MTTYLRGDVVVIKYPHTDGRAEEIRPAVVVSNDDHNANSPDVVVLAQVTGNVTAPIQAGDFLLDEWQAANLNIPSKVRLTKLFTLSKSLIRKHIGHLSPKDYEAVTANLKVVLGLDDG